MTWPSNNVPFLGLCRVHQAFLKSKDAERRLDQLLAQLQRGGLQVPPQQHSEVTNWLKEQQEEVATFRSHCLNRQKQMESLLDGLSRYDSSRDCCDLL